jgi:glucose/arabinose dehydrogenase
MHSLKHLRYAAAVGVYLLSTTAFGADPGFKVVRVASGLSQPNSVTQVPGDPSNILYYTQRAANAKDGFNTVNPMGMVMRYDTTLAGTSGYVGTPVIDLTTRNVFNDDGLEGVAFSPDFNNPSTPGFGKIFVSSSQYNGTGTVPTDRVEEYTTSNPANPTTANTSFTRTILQYNNNAQNNHTIDQIQFDPTATGEARNYLYISTGNGSFGNPYSNGVNSAPGVGMPSQNPADPKGKILRVDVNDSLPDAYADTNKNFAIPSTNPVVQYNAAHPTAPLMGANAAGPTPANGEDFITGLRNTYRFTFDRATGNMYLGDVGENAVEEVDFIPAGFNTGVGSTAFNSHGPVDFGWPEKEGTHASPVSGAPSGTTNPFTGATSVLPIQQFTHTAGNAVIGGYVYNGPIASLKGQYFFSDFVQGNIRDLNFNPTTDPSIFNGANGSVTDMTALLDSVLSDPNNPNFNASLGAAFGLGHVVSFGEDNAGNLYIVDFGGNAGDNGFSNATGEYPSAGLGAIFEIIATPEPSAMMFLLPALAGLLLLRPRTPRRA